MISKLIYSKLLPVFIELETSSLCNRQCAWCPNSIYNRGLKQKLIKTKLYNKIIYELADLDYRGEISLHNYNEPFLDKYLFNHIKKLRVGIPNAKLTIITNGDYLNKSVIEQLSDLGVSNLYITLHDAINNSNYSKVLIKLLDRIGMASKLMEKHSESGIKYYAFYNKLKIIISIPFLRKLRPRGKIITQSANNINNNNFCFLPFSACAIDFEGNMKICCEIYPANKQHYRFGIVGNLEETRFENLWFSEKYNQLRKDIIRRNNLNTICKGCSGYNLNWDNGRLRKWSNFF